MKIDRQTLIAWGLTLMLIGASVVGAWLVVGDNGQGWLSLLHRLEALSAREPLLTALIFTLIFMLTTAVTLPTTTLLCIAGGYLFGSVAGTLLSLLGALSGALITFVSVRFIAGERARDFFLRRRGRGLIHLLERDAFFFLAVLRVLPIAPFFAINAAGAMIRISLRRFLLATGLGLTPITLVYASVGSGIETVLDAGRISGPEILAQPRILSPLLALVAILIGGLLARKRILRHRRTKT